MAAGSVPAVPHTVTSIARRRNVERWRVEWIIKSRNISPLPERIGIVRTFDDAAAQAIEAALDYDRFRRLPEAVTA